MTKPKTWELHWSIKAAKRFRKLDRKTQRSIQDFINNNLINCEDPGSLGKPLMGPLKGHWRYRVGDYRLIAEIQNHKLVIMIMYVDHRKDVYKIH